MNDCWYGSNVDGCYMLLCCDVDKVAIMLIVYFVDKVVGMC